MSEPLSSGKVSTRLERIAELARRASDLVFTSVAHAIDVFFLEEALYRTRKDGAVGVDRQTAKEYEARRQENLRGLLDRFKSGCYHAPPVRRVHILKGDGPKTRPIGVPTFEDKVLQRAVTMVLEAIYEQDFRDCSWGFRPRRSAHDALERLREGLMGMHGGYVLEADIQSFFDTLEPRHLRSFLDQRVRDGVLRRTIDKWLKAGIFEDGNIKHPELGTPQGGVISPLLANIYLHHVLDVWFEDVVRPLMKGRTFLVRYADDFVIVFEKEEDARRVLEVLPKRFAKYGLTLHPDKTRLVPFQRPSLYSGPKGQDGGTGPGTFDLLGFTHLWRRTRRGGWAIQRKTAKDRFRRTLRAISRWCRENRHRKVAEQQEVLNRKLRGHYGYYGIGWNARMLHRAYEKTRRIWFKWLARRTQHAHMTWERFVALLERHPLLKPRLIPRPVTSRSEALI